MKIPEMSKKSDADAEDVGTGWSELRRVETLCGCKSEYRMTELLKTLNSKLTDAAVLLLLSSLLTEWVRGKSLDEAGEIRNTEIAQELSLPPVKIHCSVLAEDAIKEYQGLPKQT